LRRHPCGLGSRSRRGAGKGSLTKSAKFLRSALCGAEACLAIRTERHGAGRKPPMQREVFCDVGRWSTDEVLGLSVAGGRQLQSEFGRPRHPDLAARRHKKSVQHRPGLRCRRNRLGGGAKVRRWKWETKFVIHCNQDDGDDEECNGGDPPGGGGGGCSLPRSASGATRTPEDHSRSSAACSRVSSCRTAHLTWEEAPATRLTLATAYRSLWPSAAHPEAGDHVCVGRSGGLGVFGVQLARFRRQRHRHHLGEASATTDAAGAKARSTASSFPVGARCRGRHAGTTIPGSRRRASSGRRSGTSPASGTSISCRASRQRR